jgi:hypothetical protein
MLCVRLYSYHIVGDSICVLAVGDDNLLGLFLKHSQWPPKVFALPGLRANAASKPSLDI